MSIRENLQALIQEEEKRVKDSFGYKFDGSRNRLVLLQLVLSRLVLVL